MKNEKGITLLEILASITLLSIISIFAFNIIVSSMEQQKVQKQEQSNLFDLTYALKLITKDLRMSTDFDEDTGIFSKKSTYISKYKINSSNELIKTTYISNTNYTTSVIAKDLTSFKIIQSDSAVTIKITNGSKQTINNTLYFRKGE